MLIFAFYGVFSRGAITILLTRLKGVQRLSTARTSALFVKLENILSFGIQKQPAFRQTAFGYYIEYFVFLCCLIYRERVNSKFDCFFCDFFTATYSKGCFLS